MSTILKPTSKTENAKTVNGVSLDRLIAIGPRGGKKIYWRRADRRESPTRMVSTWDDTQAGALSR